MSQGNSSIIESPRRRSGLLRDQVQLVKKKDSSRYEIAPIQDPLSFEKGFFVVIRACQLLVQKNEGILLVGVAGPSGAGNRLITSTRGTSDGLICDAELWDCLASAKLEEEKVLYN